MDAEPGPARLQIAAGDDAAAVVPLVKRRRSARVGLVAVADEDERPVRMDAMGEGDDTHAAHIGAARALAKCVTDRFMLYRSEEHTSELQSLMRIAYAVFCLKDRINEATA